MSEHIDFSEQFYTAPEVHEVFARRSIQELQEAICSFDEPLRWRSSDGKSILRALPLKFREDSDEPVPYGRLHDMSYMALMTSMQQWTINRMTARHDLGHILHENFVITQDRMIVATTTSSFEILGQGSQAEFERNVVQSELGRAENAQVASIRDYANIDNALKDLKPLADQKMDEFMEYLRNMTKEDMRNYRAARRNWIIEPEQDKLSEPKYWGVTVGSGLWLVKANNPDAAILDLEDHFDLRLESLPLFFIEPYEDKIQTELSNKFPEGDIKRLIPFSMVEWPENFDELTEEQENALKKLEE